MASYRIAVIKHDVECDIKPSRVTLCRAGGFGELCSDYDFEMRYQGQGYKSPQYIKKRYFNCPIYDYYAWKLMEGSDCIGILFGRQIEVNDHKVLRLVDYLGDLQNLSKIGTAVQEILVENEYEYADMLAGTLPEELMKRSGFTLRSEDDENIIPDYFEPFVQKNVNKYFVKSNPEIVVFKAEGDQDRPSIRPASWR
jgi:hypothetical protein